jgi:ABC-2 type transport system ATP-binding protein
MYAIEAQSLTKTYPGGVQAVKGIEFEVDAGEVFGLLGPNGAGKSTTVGMLTTTIVPTTGRATVGGYDVAKQPLLARSVSSVVFQEAVVDRSLTGRANLELHAALWGVPTTRRIPEIAGLLGLKELIGRPVGSYSGGERRRLEIARALVSDPEVLFLDEPTVGMDVEGRRSFIERIAEFAQMGRTVVLTTHYLEEADQLAKRVIVIDRGLVIADASPQEIKSKVAGKRVRFTAVALTEKDLDGLPITTSTVADHHVQLLTNQPEAVLRELFRRGIEISDLEVSGADLEDAFISLTTHKPAG